MATFTNLHDAQVILNDENGHSVLFTPLQKRSGLSNYFENYTSALLTSPILVRVGELDGEGDIPQGVIDEENLIENPGSINTYPVTRAADSSNLNPTNANADRVHKVSWNSANDVSRRQIDTRFVGLRDVPTEDQTEVIATVTALNAPSVYDITATDGPMKVNGRRATAEDAAANPAVQEGELYTAFGEMLVTDDGTTDDGIYFFSIQGNGTEGSGATFVFVADTVNAPTANVPVPVATGSIIDANGTSYITLAAFTNGAAADTVDMTVNWAQNPSTAAQFAAAVPLASAQEGLFFQEQESNGTLFVVKDGVVYAFAGTAKASLS